MQHIAAQRILEQHRAARHPSTAIQILYEIFVRNLFGVFKDLCKYMSQHLRRLKGTNVYNFTSRPNRSQMCNTGDQLIHQNARAHMRCEAKQRMLLHSLNIANGKLSPLGSNSKRPTFLMSNYWEPYIICSFLFKKWHIFVASQFVDSYFPPHGIPPPPPTVLTGP